MKLKEVLESYGALQILCRSGIRASISMRLARMLNMLKNIAQEFDEMQKQKIKDYGLESVLDLNGMLTLTDEHTPEAREKFTEAFKSLIGDLVEAKNSEYELPTIDVVSINDLKRYDGAEIDTPPEILEKLLWLILDNTNLPKE